jgi:type IV pilus assembly protein PilF
MKRLGILCVAVALLGVSFASAADDEIKLNAKQRREAAEANTQLALAYMRENDLTTARAKLERALDQDPNLATTQMTAGFLYDRLGETERADGHFERAMKLGKDDPIIMNNYAAFLCRKGDKKRGEALFLQAAESPLYRTPAVAYANAGRCARADGRPKDAEKYFRQALAIQADQVDALYQMAELYFETGNYLQARAFLDRYQSSAQVSAASLWLDYRIERAMGDYEQAKASASRLKRDFALSEEVGKLLEAERAQQ